MRMVAACLLPRLPAHCAGVLSSLQDASAHQDPGPLGLDRSTHPRAVCVDPMAIVVSSSGGEPRSVERLIDANDQALGLSVRPGQRILEAQLFAPALQVRTVSKERLGCELSFLAELLFAHSPVVEPVPPSASVTLPFYAVVVDLTGAARPVSQILVAMARTLAGAGPVSYTHLDVYKRQG